MIGKRTSLRVRIHTFSQWLRDQFGSIGTAARAMLFGYLFFAAFVYYDYFTLDSVSGASKVDLLFFPLIPGVAAAFSYRLVFRWCRDRLNVQRAALTRRGGGLFFVKCTGILFAAWLPVFFAYYPGLFTYDADAQIIHVLKNTYYTHHPVLHTWLLGVFYRLGGQIGDLNLGMALYTLLQMLLFAAAIAYMMLFLRSMGWARPLLIGTLAFFAFMPFVSVLSISMTKDILFAAAFLALFVHLCRGILDRQLLYSRKYCIGFVILAVLSGLLRNNGVFALIGMLIAAGAVTVVTRKMGRVVLLSALSIAALFVCHNALIEVFHANKGTINEMLSVPYQQIAAVYSTHADDLSEEERELVTRFLPDVEDYYPALSDPVKLNARATEDLHAFFSLYGRLLARYPQIYVRAALELIQGYWALNDTSHAQIYGGRIEDRYGYLLTNTKPKFGIEHRTYFAPLEALYERLFSGNEYLCMPLLRYLFSPALYMWMIGLCCLYAIEMRSGHVVVPLGFLAGFIATLLAGPCCVIRYALPYVLCVPVLYAVSFQRPAEELS